LKEKDLGLSPTGSTSELIARLNEADPTGAWTQDAFETVVTDPADTAVPLAVADYQREIEMCRREKEFADRELAVARAELQILRGMQQTRCPTESSK